jgi:hypothetical protein
MKAMSYVIGILFAGALSMGCVAQAGTDDSSSAQEGLEYTAPAAAQKQEVSAKSRLQVTPALAQPGATGLEQLKELKSTADPDPSGNVEDDGDGKEPDPHPWHTNAAAAIAR